MAKSDPHLTSGGVKTIPAAVFRIWRNRQRIEIEAAHVFGMLARDIARLRGTSDPVARLAAKASEDELRHEVLCRQILALSQAPVPLIPADTSFRLGPASLSPEQRALYAAVAVGCVTETLSTALLIEMRSRALPGLIRDTVHEILEDEIDHGRVGWSELAFQARHTNVSWLEPHVEKMIRDALHSEVAPMLSQEEASMDLSPWGILSPRMASEVMRETIAKVIIPGLRGFGIDGVDSVLTRGSVFDWPSECSTPASGSGEPALRSASAGTSR